MTHSESANDQLAAALRSHRQGKLQAAEQGYQAVLRSDPQNADAIHLLGVIAHQVGRHELAIERIQQAIILNPWAPSFHSNLGQALHALGQYSEAIAAYRRATELQPDFVDAHLGLAITLRHVGRQQEAAESHRRLLAIQPQHLKSLVGLGNVCRDMGKLDEAKSLFRRALDIQPDYAAAHRNLAMSLLVEGNFKQGLPEYEWRAESHRLSTHEFTQPVWDGAAMTGSLLVHAEQGLGDTLQFVRFLPQAKEHVGRVILECQQPLVPLLKSADGIDTLIARGEPLPEYDRYCPLLSLPRLLQTEVETIPAEIPYLHADPRLVARWRDILAQLDGFKIGICWQGSPERSRDHWRSVSVEHFLPLARMPGVRLVSLQKHDGTEQLESERITEQFEGAQPVVQFESLDCDEGPFMDTAAIMRHLDLVITCDTVTVHLAGALGVPTWLTLGFAADWRWFLDRDDSPWYPTVRLFRQPRFGDWDSVFESIRQAVAARLGLGRE